MRTGIDPIYNNQGLIVLLVGRKAELIE